MPSQSDTKSGCRPTSRLVLFHTSLLGVGGAERNMLEAAQYFTEKGFEVTLLLFNLRPEALFSQTYTPNIELLGEITNSKNISIRTFWRVWSLRRKLQSLKPCLVLSQGAGGCIYLYLATLFTKIPYATYIHGTIFWFPNETLKYTHTFRRVFGEIRNSVVGHQQFIPVASPHLTLWGRLLDEVIAALEYLAVRKAKRIFVLSSQMAWEVKKLYGKIAVPVRGAFHDSIFSYQSVRDIKAELGLVGKQIILNINRLDPRKRVDLLIRGFKRITERQDDIVLLIGGVGPEEAKLRNLAQSLGIQDRVRFLGFIEEEELWDYYAACDVFAHPNWADFALAPFEALAMQKKVVWSSEMELDVDLARNPHIFPADPTAEAISDALERALTARILETSDMSAYTWERYYATIHRELEAYMGNVQVVLGAEHS